MHAVRKRIGDDVHLMVDYNQVLGVDEALARGRALDAENIYWLEEPIRHDDYAGAARLARELKMPIQIGENFSLPAGMATALEQSAADYVMPDLERIGGVTGWRQAAELAAVNRIKMSSHLFPEVSAHLLAATPTCHYLEYVDWANVLVQEPLAIVDGHAIVPERPGNGMVWNEDAGRTLSHDELAQLQLEQLDRIVAADLRAVGLADLGLVEPLRAFVDVLERPVDREHHALGAHLGHGIDQRRACGSCPTW